MRSIKCIAIEKAAIAAHEKPTSAHKINNPFPAYQFPPSDLQENHFFDENRDKNK